MSKNKLKIQIVKGPTNTIEKNAGMDVMFSMRSYLQDIKEINVDKMSFKAYRTHHEIKIVFDSTLSQLSLCDKINSVCRKALEQHSISEECIKYDLKGVKEKQVKRKPVKKQK